MKNPPMISIITKKNYFVILLFAFIVTCCDSNKVEDIKTNLPQSPSLNKQDSILMIEIYNKIGPWGNKWDLHNIQTWDRVKTFYLQIFIETD